MKRLAATTCVALVCSAAADEPLRNWFGDPFFQVSSAIAGCPTPAGPYVTRADMLAQSHRRAEKGTTAWLAGESERPKAYAYDTEIAAGIKQAFEGDQRFAGSTLWITVQGRVVYVEGCVPATTDVGALEAMVSAVRDVQRAVAIVRAGPDVRVPYRVLAPQRVER